MDEKQAQQPSIGQRIAEARKRQFVGREVECDLLRSALLAPDLPFCILYLYGPGGVGKPRSSNRLPDCAAGLVLKPSF